MKLLAGNSNRPLADAIAASLDIPLTRAQVKRFADNEAWVGVGVAGSTPVMTQWQEFVRHQARLHDAANVYIADAAPFVCGGTQNTTWSILAMAWRTMDHLKEHLRAGDA